MLQPSGSGSIAEDIARNGVAHVPGLIDAAACARLVEAINYCRAHPGTNFRTLSPEGRPAVQSDLFRRHDVEAIREVAMEGPLPRLAAEIFGTGEVILLEDQWFYSEGGSGTPSPWHQDHPYHPLEPWFLTIWVPLDPVPGPVGIRAIPGSHAGDVYAPVEFSAGKATLDTGGIVLRPVPDIDAHPERYGVYEPQTAPGDAVLLDSRTLHAAGGLCEATFRRLSIRYAPPTTRYRLRPWPIASFWSEHEPKQDVELPEAPFPRVSVGMTARPAG